MNQFPAKYPGRCTKCSGQIKPGDLINFPPASHVTCPPIQTSLVKSPSISSPDISAIPSGRYLVNTTDGEIMLAVDNLILDPPKPSQASSWANWVFVKRITAHDSKGTKAGSQRPPTKAVMFATPLTSYIGPYPAAMKLIAADPLAAAIAFGRQTSHCSRCNRKLTNPHSIAQSMGPICIQHFQPTA
jgi:hypothetical protein